MKTKDRVIFHIDEESNWTQLLNNIKNLKNAYLENDEDVEIEILANANAVKYYVEKENEEDNKKIIQEWTKKDVTFVACHNSLKGQNITEKNLCAEVQTVPAVVAELVKKQKAGYAYIKL